MKLAEAKAGEKSIREIPKGLPIGKSKAVRGIIAACAFYSPSSSTKPCPKFLYPNFQFIFIDYVFKKLPLKAAYSQNTFFRLISKKARQKFKTSEKKSPLLCN